MCLSNLDLRQRLPASAPLGSTRRGCLFPNREPAILEDVRIIAKRTLREFWTKHADAMEPLKAWYAVVSRADWKGPADMKATFGNASIVGNNRVVFNIKGNDYRLVARFAYPFARCWVRFIGTHAEYDRIDASTI